MAPEAQQCQDTVTVVRFQARTRVAAGLEPEAPVVQVIMTARLLAASGTHDVKFRSGQW
jgi:hypothetical protein